MLREGRTLRELCEIADRVYGPKASFLERQPQMLATLGALKKRPWGEQDPDKVAAIWAACKEVIG